MTSFHFYLYLVAFITVGITLYGYKARKFNAPYVVVVDLGDTVVVRQSPLSRVTKRLAKTINKTDIAKLQRSKNCLTLFTHSDNAYDIWLSEKHIHDTIEHCKNLFPTAKYNEIKD